MEQGAFQFENGGISRTKRSPTMCSRTRRPKRFAVSSCLSPPWRNAAICIVLDVQSASRLHVLFGGDTYQFRSRLIDLGYALQQTSSGQWWHKWSLMDATSERDMTQLKSILGPGLFCNAAVFVRVLREPDVPAVEVTGAMQIFLQDLCTQDQIFMMPV